MTPSSDPTPARYTLIPRVLVIATRGDELLLIRRAAHKKLWPGIVNAPGGHVEAGEDPLQAAQRELWEETGVDAATLVLRGLLTTDSPQAGTGVLVFVYRATVRDTQLRASDEGTPLWLPRAQLHTVPTLPDFPALLSLALDHHAFFYALKTRTPDGEEHLRLRLSAENGEMEHREG